MRISSMFEKGTVFSFEVFPPKKTSPIESIYSTLEKLGELSPDFISVTYGAAGKTDKMSTCEIASIIREKCSVVPAVHLPCINYTKEEVLNILEEFKENGIENILALRGDMIPGVPPKTDFKYASELVEFIKAHGDFDIAAACYPEGHAESPDIVEDIRHLKEKVDAGAEHLISQLFFDNSCFYSFLERTKIAGINVPIEAGIMPVTNKKQIERMVSLCGASLPSKFTKMMQRYENSPEAIRDAGIAYAVDQIVDLTANGVDGVHIYTMNNPYVASRISEAVKSLIKC